MTYDLSSSHAKSQQSWRLFTWKSSNATFTLVLSFFFSYLLGAFICLITLLLQAHIQQSLNSSTHCLWKTFFYYLPCSGQFFSYNQQFLPIFLQPYQRTQTHTHTHTQLERCSSLFPVFRSFTEYQGPSGSLAHSALPRCQCTVLMHPLTSVLPLWGVCVSLSLTPAADTVHSCEVTSSTCLSHLAVCKCLKFGCLKNRE